MQLLGLYDQYRLDHTAMGDLRGQSEGIAILQDELVVPLDVIRVAGLERLRVRFC